KDGMNRAMEKLFDKFRFDLRIFRGQEYLFFALDNLMVEIEKQLISIKEEFQLNLGLNNDECEVKVEKYMRESSELREVIKKLQSDVDVHKESAEFAKEELSRVKSLIKEANNKRCDVQVQTEEMVNIKTYVCQERSKDINDDDITSNSKNELNKLSHSITLYNVVEERSHIQCKKIKTIRCFVCDKLGHSSWNCWNRKRESVWIKYNKRKYNVRTDSGFSSSDAAENSWQERSNSANCQNWRSTFPQQSNKTNKEKNQYSSWRDSSQWYRENRTRNEDWKLRNYGCFTGGSQGHVRRQCFRSRTWHQQKDKSHEDLERSITKLTKVVGTFSRNLSLLLPKLELQHRILPETDVEFKKGGV
ncbi:hypothetical protein B4U80_12019, partial [Leptotrombidium deliense]